MTARVRSKDGTPIAFERSGERAARVRVPTLVIGGANSPEKLRHAVEATGAVVPGAERCFLKGQTHNVSPQALAPVLTEYFAA